MLTTVNVPYGTNYTRDGLVTVLRRTTNVADRDCTAFAFFSEVDVAQQLEFIAATGLDLATMKDQAKAFSRLAGYAMPLCDTAAQNTALNSERAP